MTEQISNQTHPESELLVAFAEHSLTPHERETVLQHLADCAECREILFLAQFGLLEEQPAEVFAPEPVSRPNWFGWRPITIAACLLLTVGVLSEQIYQRTRSTNQTVAKYTPAPQPQPATDNLVKNTSISPAVATPAPAQAPLDAPLPNAVVAEKVPQQEESKRTLQPNFKAAAPPMTLMGDEHPVASSASASLQHLQQEHATEVHTQDAAVHPMPNSAGGTSIKQASVSQTTPANTEVYSAPTTSSGFSPNYAPGAETSTNIISRDRSAFNSKGASANTRAVTRPSILPSGQVIRDSLLVNGRKLAIDQDGRLYASIDQGASWREIHKQWSGTATMLILVPQSSSTDANKVDEAGGDAVKLLNSANATWISTDGGESWKPYSKKN